MLCVGTRLVCATAFVSGRETEGVERAGDKDSANDTCDRLRTLGPLTSQALALFAITVSI